MSRLNRAVVAVGENASPSGWLAEGLAVLKQSSRCVNPDRSGSKTFGVA